MNSRMSWGVVLAFAAGCGESVYYQPDLGAIDDVSVSETTQEERAGCSMLMTRCGAAEAACLRGMVDRRLRAADADCTEQYDAWLACVTALEDCPSGSVVCPQEYTALGKCVSP